MDRQQEAQELSSKMGGENAKKKHPREFLCECFNKPTVI
jgi:hypothetical protein